MLHKVFEHFKLFFVFKKGKKVYYKTRTFLVIFILFMNDVIRNLLHDNIGFVQLHVRGTLRGKNNDDLINLLSIILPKMKFKI